MLYFAYNRIIRNFKQVCYILISSCSCLFVLKALAKKSVLQNDFRLFKKVNVFLKGVSTFSNLSQLAARKFLDDEAELSQQEAEYVSSDENDESENEQDSSLLDFLNDETQLSQAINGK